MHGFDTVEAVLGEGLAQARGSGCGSASALRLSRRARASSSIAARRTSWPGCAAAARAVAPPSASGGRRDRRRAPRRARGRARACRSVSTGRRRCRCPSRLSRARTLGLDLGERERLGQVVVGAVREAGQLVGQLAARRDHEHRRRIAQLFAQAPEEGQAVDVRAGRGRAGRGRSDSTLQRCTAAGPL